MRPNICGFGYKKTNDIFSKSQGERGQASNSHEIELLQRGVVAQDLEGRSRKIVMFETHLSYKANKTVYNQIITNLQQRRST